LTWWAWAAAQLKASHKLSLADAFAAALAKEKKAELVTGDPEFKPLEKEVKVHWLKGWTMPAWHKDWTREEKIEIP